MTQPPAAKSNAMCKVAAIFFFTLAVSGCSGESKTDPPGKAASASESVTPAPSLSDKDKKTAKSRPLSQTPGDANYEDKPGTRGRGR